MFAEIEECLNQEGLRVRKLSIIRPEFSLYFFCRTVIMFLVWMWTLLDSLMTPTILPYIYIKQVKLENVANSLLYCGRLCISWAQMNKLELLIVNFKVSTIGVLFNIARNSLNSVSCRVIQYFKEVICNMGMYNFWPHFLKLEVCRFISPRVFEYHDETAWLLMHEK